MRTLRTRPLFSNDAGEVPAFVYGSRTPSTFVADVDAGRDSLDVIVIGDSNTGSSLAGGYGWLAGVQQALTNLGAQCYGTPIYPFIDRSPSPQARFYGNWRQTNNTIAKSASYLSGSSATSGDGLDYSSWNSNFARTTYGSSSPYGSVALGYGTLAGVVITGTAGQFSCTSTRLVLGQTVVITGTFGGTGSISGYASGTTYYIIATNGSTTFTLSATLNGSAITTTAGTPTGLTYQSGADFDDWLLLSGGASGLYQTNGVNLDVNHPLGTNGVTNWFRVRYGKVLSSSTQTISGVTITGTAGQFSCTSNASLVVGQGVTIVGTFGGTGSISGYVSGTTYWITATNGSTTFTLSQTPTGGILTTAAGTPTGLTYSLGGAFYPNVWENGSINARTRLLTAGPIPTERFGSAALELYEQSFTATGKGHTASAIGYNAPGTVFTSGPGAYLCQSLYRKDIRGFAVHSHGYQSGYDSTGIAATMTSTASSGLAVQLQEIRERQIANGGTGRVLLWVHSGINGVDTGATWTAAHIAIWEKYKTVWSSLGYPLSDLAIVSFVTPPQNLADTSGSGANLVPVRAAGVSMVATYPDMTVVDIKSLYPYEALVYGGGQMSLYQRFGDAPNVGSDIVVHLAGGFADNSVGWTLSGVAITGTAGQFSCSAAPYPLLVGMSITINGTFGGTGSITGYTNGTKYFITATNGSTTFTLSTTYGGAGVVTTAGTPTGLTYTATNVATVTTANSITLTGNLAVLADGYWRGSTLYIDLVAGSASAPAYQTALVTAYNGTTKVATVSQWTGGQPTNGVASEIRFARKHPMDGYTTLAQAVLTSLTAEQS